MGTLYESAIETTGEELVDWLIGPTTPPGEVLGGRGIEDAPVPAQADASGFTGEARVSDPPAHHGSEVAVTAPSMPEAMASTGSVIPGLAHRPGVAEGLDETSKHVGGLSSRAEQLEGLRAIEDRLLAKSLITTEASLEWADIDLKDLPGSEAKFIERHGPEDGPKRFRIAMANWSTAKHAPVGLKNSIAVTLGALKAKSGREAAPQSLNMTFVQITAPQAEIMDAITVGVDE